MKRNYDDYDFDKFYGDVNDNYYESDSWYCTPVNASYDTYTGRSDNYYSDWN